ncbi:MAG: type I-B CRISPR-associated protein Cas7/Cst2/DevR [Fervidobacterium sp.]
MKKPKIVSFTVVFQAQSLNYGEGFGNIAELKKFTRGDGMQYTFVSRQALRYDIVRLGHQLFGWNLETLDSSKGTIQFKEDVTIKDSEEMDLFGYMKTKRGGKKAKSEAEEEIEKGAFTRSAVVRLTHAISLEPYKSDLEFLSNMGFAQRLNENPNIANIEQHFSFYSYTVTIDLNRVGIDGAIKLSNEERYKRVSQLLDIVKILNREIRGRIENLSPVFVIGGVYSLPFALFSGIIKLSFKNGKPNIDLKPIQSVIETTVGECNIKQDTSYGIVKGIFENESEIHKLIIGSDGELISPTKFFENLKEKIREYYGVN